MDRSLEQPRSRAGPFSLFDQHRLSIPDRAGGRWRRSRHRISALRSYWGQALAARPDLKFELLDVLVGHECLTVLYRNHRGQHAAETFEFGADGKIVRSFACYGQPGATS